MKKKRLLKSVLETRLGSTGKEAEQRKSGKKSRRQSLNVMNKTVKEESFK